MACKCGCRGLAQHILQEEGGAAWAPTVSHCPSVGSGVVALRTLVQRTQHFGEERSSIELCTYYVVHMCSPTRHHELGWWHWAAPFPSVTPLLLLLGAKQTVLALAARQAHGGHTPTMMLGPNGEAFPPPPTCRVLMKRPCAFTGTSAPASSCSQIGNGRRVHHTTPRVMSFVWLA